MSTRTRTAVKKTAAAAEGPALKSLVRALRLLRAVYGSTQSRGLAELCREHGLHKTTGLRLLRSLVAHGLISREEGSGRYLTDPSLWVTITPFIRPALAFISDLQGLLDRTARCERATALIMMPDERRRGVEVPIYGLPGVPVQFDPRHGAMTPLHATAGGRCYLAYVPGEELAEYISAGLGRAAPGRAGSAKRLRQELALVREQGYALNRTVSATSVAAPLRTQGGEVIGGLSLICAEAEFDAAHLAERVAALQGAAEMICRLLSYESFRNYMREAEPNAPVPPAEEEGGLAGSTGGATELTRSVGRAFRLMDTLWDLGDGESIAGLARRRGLTRATTYRLLKSLAAEHMVCQEPSTGRYHIDPVHWLRQAPILGRTAPMDKLLSLLLEQLARSANATALLASRDAGNRRAVPIAHALPRRPIVFRPGNEPFPMLHTVAAGKCLLAAQPESGLAAYVRGGLEAATQHTITSPAELAEELRGVRQSGYAICREELMAGVGGVAVPVRNRDGQVVAALAFAFLISELTDRNVGRWVEQLRVGSGAVSRVLAAARTARDSRDRGWPA